MSELSPDETFGTLKTNVLNAIGAHFPFEGRKNKLIATNVHVDDKLSHDDIKGQAEAKDKEATWAVPVKADLKLVNKVTGQVVDEKKGAVLARLPKMTSRYGYIVNGSEYQVDHLFKLKSGAYTRVQQNGELETEFNLAKSPTNRGFSIHLDPKTQKFSFAYGDSKIPLYPILKTMGVSDDDIEKSWGKELLAYNRPKNNEKFKNALKSFWKKTSDDEVPAHEEELVRHVTSFFDNTAIRPDTTAITMGKPFNKVTGEALKIGADKVLGVSRGTHKPDDRDSLTFKEVVSIEDFLPDRISRTRGIKARLRQSVDHKEKVSDIVPPDLFNKPIHEFFTNGKSGVAERSDQTNPIQMLSAHRKTTLMSKELGGLKGEHNLTTEMKVVNPSHFGFLDPMHTPESERTGITLHLSAGVRKNGRDLEAPVYDLKSSSHKYSSVPDFHQKMVVLPDQVKWVNGKPVPISSNVKVKLPGGDVEIRPFKDADYVMPSSKGMFDFASNLVPFLPTDQGNRVSMADKQMEQAISLKHREAPLVQAKTESKDPTHTFERLVGNFVATKSTADGKVVAVKPDTITLDSGGKKHVINIYNHFPLNDPKGMMHSHPLVQVGDTVKKGQVIADTNYTKGGALATGTNLRVGYVPYKGYNFEDGIVISESAAKKLTSEHLYKKDMEIDPAKDHVSTQKLKAFAPVSASKMTREQWDALDEDGVIKVGSKVLPGQVMIAAVGANNQSKTGNLLAKLGKKALQPFKDKSLVWDEDHVGVVTRVAKSPGGKFKVYVKTEEQAVIGDKLSGRHGNKGIITRILPDHEMPHTGTGDDKKHLEILLNPSGVPTRINVGQMLETAAGKIAEKTGKPYIVNNFAGPGHDYRQELIKDLKAHGLSDEEHVYDPKDPKKPLGSVLVGPQYILKLKHQVEKKLTVRGGGTTVEGKALPYDNDRQPTKGGEKGGQGFGQLDMYALLGHDARHNLREMATYKSDMQDAVFWNMIQEGHEPPPPKVPFSYEKFTTLLKGLGVNVNKTGTGVRLMPMTHKEIIAAAGNGKNEITKGNLTLRAKDLREEKGGLFDPMATGGKDGDKWSYMKLHEPMPNPIFVGSGNKPGPVPSLLGLKMKEFEDIMAGRERLDGKTGGAAIESALKKINVDKEIESLRKTIASKTGSELDRTNKKLRYLLALKDVKMEPAEAYILKSLPVIPPKFRPASETPRGDVSFAPINGLYKNIALINNQLKDFDPKVFSEEHRVPLRSQLWDTLKALQGIGNFKPVYDTDSSGNRELPSILSTIATGKNEGGQPKEGFFQSKLVKRRLNLSLRSTIIPEPALGIDEVGLPKVAAMELYKPFVVAQLHRWGLTPLDAQKEIKTSTDIAHKALEHVIQDRPLLLKRDPVLHKYGVMAFKPKLVEGKAIQIHPLVTGGFNADFDGDTMAGTVPMSREAVEEAKKMFPSNNLFSSTTGKVMYNPGHESLLGLHLLSKWGKDTGKSFKTVQDLDKAVKDGHVGMNDAVKVDMIGAKPTTLGRILIESRLPRGFYKKDDILHNPQYEINKKMLGSEISTAIAKSHPEEFAKSIDALKDLGNEHSYKYGFSIGLKDLAPLKERESILNEAHRKVEEIKRTVTDKDAQERHIVNAYQDATQKIDEAIKKEMAGGHNRLATMVFSGARGSPEQLRQMVAAPMLMQDSSNRTIPTPVTKSYSEGLDIGDYWLAQHGARKGTLQRSQGTSEPGAISKDILNSTMSTLIVSKDCGTKNGLLMSIVPDPKDLTYKDIHDRFTAHPYKLKDGTTIKEGTLLTPEVVTRLRNNKITKIMARSPLKCEHGDGMCSTCFGLNENGKLHDVGTNIGILAGQALGEPAMQMSMDSFHTGGVATGRGAASVDRLTRLRNLLEMPKKLKQQATVSMTSGKVEAIHDAEAGGIGVFVGGTKHYVPKDLINHNLKVGDEVKKGDKLSEGYINPHSLMEATKDIHAVQNYLTNEMFDSLYDKEGVRRRNVEVAVRSFTNLTHIKDPGHSDHLPGDIVPRTVVEEFNKNLPKGHAPITHEPLLKGVEQVPALLTQNWMGRMNYRELHRAIQDAASFGMKADIHSTHPIPALAHGAEFGKPPPDLKTKKPYVY